MDGWSLPSNEFHPPENVDGVATGAPFWQQIFEGRASKKYIHLWGGELGAILLCLREISLTHLLCSLL
jgi:hypothetical protein